MRRTLRKLLCVVLALAMVLPMLPALEVSAAEGVAWTGGPFPESGSYYLAEDITLSEEVLLSGKLDVTLDLNGHCITVAPGVRGFYLNNAKMIIRDTGIGGMIQGSGVNFEGRGGIIYVKNSASVLTLESGTITGGCATERGGNIYVENGAFNMTGGVVSEGYAGARGGNIASTGTLNLSGGLITAGTAEDYGGNILSTGANCFVNVSGDVQITDGYSDGHGGNIMLIYSNVNISGGEIYGGGAKSAGLDIGTYGSASSRSTVTISGGRVGLPQGSTGVASVYLNGQEGTGCVAQISGGVIDGRINTAIIQSITLSGAPKIRHLRLAEGVRVTPVDLQPGAQIRVETTKGDDTFSGLLTNAEAYTPYFLAYLPGYGVGVVNNRLTLLPVCSCGCGKAPEEILWQSLSEYTGGTLPAGHYFVPAEGMTLTDELSVAAGTEVTLDLRGSTLTAAEAKRVFYLYGNLNLMDSVGEGKLTGGTATRGGNIYVAGGNFKLYSGAVVGGTADNNLGTGTTNGRGGNIFASSGEVHLLGGTVADGKTIDGSGYGGNICVTGQSAYLYISGDAVVRGGNAKAGGNIYAIYSHIEMSGGTVTGGTANNKTSANIHTNGTSSAGASTFTMSGGKITGGGVYLSGTTAAADSKYPDYRTIVNISGGELGQVYAAASTLRLSGAPVIQELSLATGTLITDSALTEGAAITLKAAEGEVSLPLDKVTSQAVYYQANKEGYAVGDLDGALGYGPGCICGCGELKATVAWKTWNGEAITESGHYRLANALTLSDVIEIPEGITVSIDLNDATLTAAAGKRVFQVRGTLTVADSGTNGKLTGGTAEGSSSAGYGGNVYIYGGGVFNLRSGTIADGYAAEYAGNVYVATGAVFNMYGGTITGGTSGARGGNIYMGTAQMYMYGGTMQDGTTANRGGNFFTNGGKLYIYGGTVSGGKTTGASSSTYGGNLMATGSKSEIHISGNANIYKGSAGTGTTISLMYGNLYMSGGTIHDGGVYATETTRTYSGLYFSGGTIKSAVTSAGDMADGIGTLVAITGGTFTGTFKINSAANVILSGAPSLANLTLASGVKITPVRLEAGVSIPVTAVGEFTTYLQDAQQVADHFVPTKGVISVNAGVLSMDVTENSGTSGNVTWTLSTSGVLTLTGTGAMQNYTNYVLTTNIPWKDYLSSITKVVIGEGITTIGNNAFLNCTKLTEVELASTVQTIGSNAFSGCTKLTGVELPAVLTSIGSSAFNKAGLTEITLPDTVKTLGTGAFQNCTALKQVTFGTGIKTVGSSAFKGCTALETVNYRGTAEQWESVSVNGSNTPLTDARKNYQYANSNSTKEKLTWTINNEGLLTLSGSGKMPGFYRNTALSQGRGIPWEDYTDQITAIAVTGYSSVGNWVFYNLDQVKTVTLADTVTEIEENAFRDCDKLELINLDGITKLGDNAFYGCDSLKTVTLSESLQAMGRYAFYDCDALQTLELPASLTRIGAKAFAQCDNLEAIQVNPGNPNFASANNSLTNADGTELLRVPGGYKGEFTLPETVVTVGQGAFSGCRNITDVVFTDKVETVEAAAFFGSSITGVKLGAKVTQIAPDAFSDCKELTGFAVSQENSAYKTDAFGVLYTGDFTTLVCFPGAFGGSYTVCESTTAVAEYAAAWNQSLTELTLPISVSNVGSYAFVDNSLTALQFTAGTTTVAVGAFEMAALETVSYTGTAQTWVNMSVAAHNEPLKNAKRNILTGGSCNEAIRWEISPEGVLTITGTGAMPAYSTARAPWYTDCGGITAIVLGEGITAVSKDAFYGCTAVQTVTLPASLTAVEENAFASCTAITDVYCAVTKHQWQQVTVAAGNQVFEKATLHFATAALTGISVTRLPEKQVYYQTEALELTGLELTLTYADGMTEVVTALTEEYTVTAAMNIPGQVTVTLTYGELSATFPVQVLPAGVCGENIRWTLTEGKLVLTGTGAMDSYSAEAPAPWAAYADTVTEVVIDPEITLLGSYAFASCTHLQTVPVSLQVTGIGENCFPGTATVAYAGSRTTWAAIGGSQTVPETQNITYGRVDLTEIQITAMPEKVAYLEGERLDTTGMEVTALYDDGTSRTITDYEVAADMTIPGQVEVTVTYGGKTASFPVLLSYGGYLENGLYWQYLEGALVIGYLASEEAPGSGLMADYTEEAPAPWGVHAEAITNLVVGEGVANIGTNAFSGCANMTVVTLPQTLTAIGENGFAGCDLLTEVNYAGEEEAWNGLPIEEKGNEALLAVKPQYKVMRGDLNEDGKVDFLDLGTMQAYLSGKSASANLDAGDLNGDGAVSFLDLGALQAHLSGKAPITQ